MGEPFCTSVAAFCGFIALAFVMGIALTVLVMREWEID